MTDLEKLKIIQKVFRGELSREEIYQKYQTTKEEMDSWLSMLINKDSADDTKEDKSEKTITIQTTVDYIQLKEHWQLQQKTKENYTLTLYLTEYERLLELIQTQPYGALLQIKDLYEIIVKVPVLVTASFWLKNFDQLEDKPKRGKRSKQSVLYEWIRSDLAIGDWNQAAINMYNIFDKNKKDLHPVEKTLFPLLRNIIDMYKNEEVTTWRNDRIGHGALGLFDNYEYKNELLHHMSTLANHFNDLAMNELYRQLRFNKDHHGIYVEIEKEKISLNPFFCENEHLFLFDSYHRNKDKLLYLDYTYGNKKPFEVSDLRAFLHKLNKYMDHNRINEATPEVTIQNSMLKSQLDSFKLRANLSDYMNVNYLTTWLTDQVQSKDRGIFLLKMEEGMGKTTFVKAIDEWSNLHLKNKPKIPKTHVRSVYIDSHNPNQVAYFKSDLVDQLRRFTRNGIVEEIAFPKGFSPVMVTNSHAHECKRLLKYYLEIYQNETNKDKLLFVIDGLDEVIMQEDVSILNFIPSVDMLPENVYLLLTARLDSAKEMDIPVEVDDTLEIKRVDSLNIETVQLYIEQHGHVSKEHAEEIIANLDDPRFMYIKPYIDLLKAGFTKKIGSINQLITDYLYELAKLYGRKYVKEIYRILALLCQADEPLTLHEISGLLYFKKPDFHLLGMLQDLRGWITRSDFDTEPTYAMAKDSVQQGFLQDERIQATYQELGVEWLNFIQGTVSIDNYDVLMYVLLPKMINNEEIPAWYIENVQNVADTLFLDTQTKRQYHRLIRLYEILSTLRPEDSDYYKYKISEVFYILEDYEQSIIEVSKTIEICNKQSFHEIVNDPTILYMKAMNLQWLLLQKFNLVEAREKKILKANNQTYAKVLKLLSQEQKQRPIYCFRSQEVMIKPGQVLELLQSDPQNEVLYFEYVYETIKHKIRKNLYTEAITWSEIIFHHSKENTNSTLWQTKMKFLLTLLMPNVFLDLYNKQLNGNGVKTQIPLYESGQIITVVRNTGMKSRKEYFNFRTLLFSSFGLFKQLNQQGLVAYAEMYIDALTLYVKMFDQINISKYDRIMIRNELKNIGKDFLPQSPIKAKVKKINKQFDNEYQEEKDSIKTTIEHLKLMIIDEDLGWTITDVNDILLYNLNTLEKSMKERILFEALSIKQLQLDGLQEIPSQSWKQVLHHVYDGIPTSSYTYLEKGMLTYFHSLWDYHDMLGQEPSNELRKTTVDRMFKYVEEALDYFIQYEMEQTTYTEMDVIYLAHYTQLTEQLIRQCADVINQKSAVFSKNYRLKECILNKASK